MTASAVATLPVSAAGTSAADAARRRITVEEFERLPDTGTFELVDGRVVEKPMGALSNYVAGTIIRQLSTYCQSHPVGYVFTSEQSYRCHPDDPDRIRKPDISLVRLGRFPGGKLVEGHLPFAPDLAVEVSSPGDLAWEVDRKTAEYLACGVRLVWNVNPDQQYVRVHRADGTVAMLQGEATLSGEDVVPGFECRVADLFSKPAGA